MMTTVTAVDTAVDSRYCLFFLCFVFALRALVIFVERNEAHWRCLERLIKMQWYLDGENVLKINTRAQLSI